MTKKGGPVPQFNVAEAKARFSELVQKAVSGEEVVIARLGGDVSGFVHPAVAAALSARWGHSSPRIHL